MAHSKATKFETEEMELAEIAKALGHPARIAILKFLANQSSCFCGDIVDELPLSQSTVSQHLKALKEVNLVTGDISGNKVCYCLNMEQCRKAITSLNQLFTKFKCC